MTNNLSTNYDILKNWRMWNISIIWVTWWQTIRCKHEVKSGITTTKASFNKKTLFTSQSNLYLMKKLMKCYILSTASHGAETGTLLEIYQKWVESFEIWQRRRMEIIWTNNVENKGVLHTVMQEETSYTVWNKGRLNGLVISRIGTAF